MGSESVDSYLFSKLDLIIMEFGESQHLVALEDAADLFAVQQGKSLSPPQLRTTWFSPLLRPCNSTKPWLQVTVGRDCAPVCSPAPLLASGLWSQPAHGFSLSYFEVILFLVHRDLYFSLHIAYAYMTFCHCCCFWLGDREGRKSM